MNHSSAGGEGYDHHGMSLLHANNGILNRHLGKSRKGKGRGPKNAPFLLKGGSNALKARVGELEQRLESQGIHYNELLQKLEALEAVAMCVGYEPDGAPNGASKCTFGGPNIGNVLIQSKETL